MVWQLDSNDTREGEWGGKRTREGRKVVLSNPALDVMRTCREIEREKERDRENSGIGTWLVDRSLSGRPGSRTEAKAEVSRQLSRAA